jgi:hypothetical protein
MASMRQDALLTRPAPRVSGRFFAGGGERTYAIARIFWAGPGEAHLARLAPGLPSFPRAQGLGVVDPLKRGGRRAVRRYLSQVHVPLLTRGAFRRAIAAFLSSAPYFRAGVRRGPCGPASVGAASAAPLARPCSH